MNRNEILNIVSDVDAFENLCNKFNINDGNLLPDGFDDYMTSAKKHIGNQLLKMSKIFNLDQKDFDGLVYATVYSSILRSLLNNNSAEIMLMNIALFRLFFDKVMLGDDGVPKITPAELYQCKKLLEDTINAFDMTAVISDVRSLTLDILSDIKHLFYDEIERDSRSIKDLIEITKALDVILNKLNIPCCQQNDKDGGF